MGDYLEHYGVNGMKWGKHLKANEVSAIADDVQKGLYGNGSERKDKLGDAYDVVQKEVNSRYESKANKKKTKQSKKSKDSKRLSALADQAIRGELGNGDARKNALGKDYEKVQNLVNRKLLGDKQASAIAKRNGWSVDKASKVTKAAKQSAKKTAKKDSKAKQRGKKFIEQKKKTKTLKHYVADESSLTSISHYGVKGMKWGVRRTPEQLGHKKAPKRVKNGFKKAPKRVGTVLKKFGKKTVKASANEVKAGAKHIETKQKQHERAIANDPAHGLNQEQRKLRDAALKSTDPKVVYEGRKYLTDEELSNKIKRINMEQNIKKQIPAPEKTTGQKIGEAVGKAALKGASAGVEKVASTLVERSLGPGASALGDYFGKQLAGTKINGKAEKATENAAKKNQSSNANRKPSDYSQATKDRGKDAVDKAVRDFDSDDPFGFNKEKRQEIQYKSDKM